MMIGDDVAVLGVDDDAGACAFELPLVRPGIGRCVEEAAKEGVIEQGIALPGCSLMVPRVAIFTTEGETRLTMGASDGIGAASAGSDARGRAGVCRRSAAASGERRGERRGCQTETQIHARSIPRVQLPASRRPDFRPAPLPYRRDITRKIRAERSLLGSFHRDPVRLHLRQLRNRDLQNAIDEFRLDVLRIRSFGQAEAALEFAADALDPAETLTRLLAGLLALTANGQHALIGGDFHRFGIHARQINMQHELVCFLNEYRPAATRRRNLRPWSTARRTNDRFLLKPADECPRLITYDGHCLILLIKRKNLKLKNL